MVKFLHLRDSPAAVGQKVEVKVGANAWTFMHKF